MIQLVVPISWEKIGDVVRSAMIRMYGSEADARRAYEAPNQALRLELTQTPNDTVNAA